MYLLLSIRCSDTQEKDPACFLRKMVGGKEGFFFSWFSRAQSSGCGSLKKHLPHFDIENTSEPVGRSTVESHLPEVLNLVYLLLIDNFFHSKDELSLIWEVFRSEVGLVRYVLTF